MDNLSLFKCKNCGEFTLDPNRAVGGVIKCSVCGFLGTSPKREISSAALSSLRQGEHDLDVCHFDDAYTAYQKAAELDPKEPEAYFGMALARFNVQYLKDEVNDHLQPICHEISDKVFTEDKNYKKALDLATVEQKKVYRKRGGEIDDIRDEFFALQKSGDRYDCFLCAKVSETDDDLSDGKKVNKETRDSVLASEIYYALKDKGYRPFYSEREMKGRTGSAYEALILYALCTSECMLIVCSNEDYLQTKWVKSEYSRFLELMKNGSKERDALTFVFSGKPIEKLPNGKKIQGIDYSKPQDAYLQIFDFVKSHMPETKKRAEEEARKPDEGAEEQKKQLAAMQKQLDALTKRQEAINVSKKAAPIVPLSKEFTIKGTTLVDYKGEDEVVEIPDKIRKIDEAAFSENQMIQKIIMPDSLAIIGNWAFLGCTGLKEVVLPPNLKDVGEAAFQSCVRLTKITIPKSVEVMGEDVFAECHCDIYVEADSAGNSWKKSWNGSTGQVFWGCNSKEERAAKKQQEQRVSRLEDDGKKSVPIVPVSGKFNIQGTTLVRYRGEDEVVQIPDGIRRIGNIAFCACKSIQKVIIPNSVSIIDESAFFDCTGLREVTLPPNVNEIGRLAFRNCARLTKITIPKSVEVIGDDAFAGSHCDIYVEAEKAGQAWHKTWNGSSGQVFWGCGSKREQMQTAQPDRLTNGVQSAVGNKLTRAWQEMDAHNFAQAKRYFTSVIDSDPTNAEAWRGMFLADFDVTNEKALLDQISTSNAEDVIQNKNLKNFLQYKTTNTYDKSYHAIQRKSESVLLEMKDDLEQQAGKLSRNSRRWNILRIVLIVLATAVIGFLLYGIAGALMKLFHFSVNTVILMVVCFAVGFVLAAVLVLILLRRKGLHNRRKISFINGEAKRLGSLIQSSRQQFKTLQNQK